MSSELVPDLSVIIVSWNVRDLLRACLGSVLTQMDPATLEVIVVDNGSSDGSAVMVTSEFPQVRLAANPDNRGFTRGNNQGLSAARGRYVLFLNPDTVVAEGALRTMLTYMEAHPEVGALGPQLRYGDGTLQSSRRRFPTFATALLESTPLAWRWRDNPWERRYHLAEQPADSTQEVDWLVGAALLTRRAVLDRIGGFDEGYFMYSEELDWCRRAKAAGWRIVYLPAAEVVHFEGRSSEQAIAARHIRFQSSKVRYFRKFHGPVAAESLRLAVLTMFAVEWLLEGGKWLLGSRRSLRQERMRAYEELLQSGLKSPLLP